MGAGQDKCKNKRHPKSLLMEHSGTPSGVGEGGTPKARRMKVRIHSETATLRSQ